MQWTWYRINLATELIAEIYREGFFEQSYIKSNNKIDKQGYVLANIRKNYDKMHCYDWSNKSYVNWKVLLWINL